METHIVNACFILLGSLIYILFGVAKFKKRKKGKWSLREWLGLNGLETFIGIVCCLALYALQLAPTTHLGLFTLGFTLDAAVKVLSALASTKKAG